MEAVTKDLNTIIKTIAKHTVPASALNPDRLLVSDLPLEVCNEIAKRSAELNDYQVIVVTDEARQRSEIMTARNSGLAREIFIYAGKGFGCHVMPEIATTTKRINFTKAPVNRLRKHFIS